MWRLLVILPLAALAEYCNAGNTVEGDSNLGKVQLTGSKGTNINDNTDCPGVVGIRDLTALSASLAPGGNYSLNFQATTCESGWARLAYAYIDFNGNEFYDANELIGQVSLDNRVAPIDVTLQFTVPCLNSGAVAGNTRMRVFVVESGFSPNPCLTFSYGGVKEFSINILDQACSSPGPYCKAGNSVAQGSNLGAVVFVGELDTDIKDTSNCPGVTGVRDLTNLSASVYLGSEYVLDFDVTTCNGKGYPRLAYAYVDFNRNDVYDPNELVGAMDVGNDVSPVSVLFKVTVPCNAVPGATRMRVIAAEGAHDADPCLIFAYGGAKEYSIVIETQPCPPSPSVAVQKRVGISVRN